MVIKLFKWILFVILCICTALVHSQQNESINGLLKLLDRPDDSTKVVTLKLLCWEYRNIDTASAIKYGTKAIELAESLALNYELADAYNRFGVVRRNQGMYSHALDNYFKGIEISKKYNYKTLLAYAYNNIADIYNRLGIYDKALEFGKYGLTISSTLDDKYTLSYIYNILGLTYKYKNNFDSALLYFRNSLFLRKEINFTSGIATSALNIGNIQSLKGEYDSCFLNISKSIEIYTNNNDKTGLAKAYMNLGSYYNKIQDYNKAIYYYNKCLALNEKFGDLQIAKEANDGLNFSFIQLGDIKKAYYYKDRACRIGDSITINLFVERITHLTENYKFELKRKEDDLIRKEKESLLNHQIKYQRSLITFYIFILLLLGILVFVTVYHHQQKNKVIKTLKKQKAEIDELNSTKDKLFSILAHDLKNPISSVIAIAEFLKNEPATIDKEKHQKLLNSLYEVGKSTNAILQEVLGWAQIQTDKVVVMSEIVDLKNIINNVIENQTTIASNKNISIVNTIIEKFEVKTDSYIVSTVLRNLISNAIKFSRQGGAIDVSGENLTESYRISVCDKGVGMSDEQKNNIFASTTINPTFGTDNERGIGLGLIICKELVSKLGGKIWLESELDKGTTFTFEIPK
ncbi:MAG: ATP-binding protein [Bacteroidales bacterium]